MSRGLSTSMPKQKGGNEMSSAMQRKMGAYKIIYFFILLGFVLFLVTCSGAQSDKPSATSSKTTQSQVSESGINACKLLTREELEPAIGGEIAGYGELLQHGPGNSECLFQYEDNRIFVRYKAGTSSFDYNKIMAKGEPVSGVGDEAYWYPISKTLEARVKGNTLEIEMLFPPNSASGDLKSAAIELAKKAASRM